jgi:MbtH protein
MESTTNNQTTQYKVVVNSEGQYSIWPINQPNPAGWHNAGKEGTQDECLDYIENVWIDMRALSVRKHLADCVAEWAPEHNNGNKPTVSTAN